MYLEVINVTMQQDKHQDKNLQNFMKALSYYGPKLWTSLPKQIRTKPYQTE